MSGSLCDRCVKIVVYYVIFSNILLPMVLLLFDDPHSCISLSDILSSVVWIISGVLLLIGTLQGKEKYIRIYVMLTSVCLLVGPIYVALYPGNGFFCEKRNTITMILIVLYFIMMWPFQYCIYLFYKQMANVNVGESVVAVTLTDEEKHVEDSLLQETRVEEVPQNQV